MVYSSDEARVMSYGLRWLWAAVAVWMVAGCGSEITKPLEVDAAKDVVSFVDVGDL